VLDNLIFETPTEWVVLGLTLVAGWLFGLASAPGGKKWRERYEEEELAHAQYRDRAEADLREANMRIRDLQAERDRAVRDARAAPPPAPAPVPVVAAAPAVVEEAPAVVEPAPAVIEATPVAVEEAPASDSLSRIRGIDAGREARLNELGVKTFREIEKMSAEDEASLEDRLGLDRGTIANEQWREQAALLRAGNTDEHASRFGG
jgi:predicted flap endonuclease-1-like 5' DNA nuclease